MNIREKLNWVRARVDDALRRSGRSGATVRIVAASKYADTDTTRALIDAGIEVLGENRIQDALPKMEALKDYRVSWHMIGHLQTNKVKKAVLHFDCIQSVDTLHVLEKIDAEAEKCGKIMPVLMQLNVAEEESKFGFSEEEIRVNAPRIFSFSNVRVDGIMAMAPHTHDANALRSCFRRTKHMFDDLKRIYPGLAELSMGMSNDFELAVEEGATIIRIGRLLFSAESGEG